jgi:hypothetical protein
MTEVKYDRSHPAGATPEARLNKRLDNSGDAKNADVVTKHGEGARRTYHNIFNAGHKIQPGTLPDKDAGR